MTEQNKKKINEDEITEAPPNGMFRVRLDTEDLILDYGSGKI
uniref:Translation initiation factor 1 n=1 Tax=Plocama pendula TaxID=58388 RepID=A0A6F8F0R9_9GENT|nr:translation initiation factor 1 [Plocama pendula]